MRSGHRVAVVVREPTVTPPDAIDSAWMTRFVREIGYDAAVASVQHEIVGTGQMAQNRRFRLQYSTPAPGAPESFVGKFPSPEPTSRRTGGMGAYLKEVSFYREIKPTVGIRTPIVHRIEFDPGTSDFLLMMEDMAPARQGDQMAGGTVAQAEVAMGEIARLHAPRWADPNLDRYEFLGGRRGSITPEIYGMLWQGFLGRYQEILEPGLIELGRRLEQRFPTYSRIYPGPRTVTHGDFRLDNTLIGRGSDGRPTVATVDWQTVGIGCGALDVAYFIGAGLLPEVRRAHEQELVRRYHAALQEGGVGDYSFDQLWHDYRWYSYAGYVMAVVATTLVVQTARGDEMFLTMARRHGQQVLDMESERLLDEAAS